MSNNSSSTGANSPLGIGRASAHQFAHNDARAIYLCDFVAEYLSAHQHELRSLYPDVDIHIRQFDAADEAAMKAVIDEAIAEYGRLDIMFANAGIVGTNQSFLNTNSDDFMKTMRTNVLRQVSRFLKFRYQTTEKDQLSITPATNFNNQYIQRLRCNQTCRKSHASNLPFQASPLRIYHCYGLRRGTSLKCGL